MSISRTIVISCAGMGNRLGMGNTKALVEIEGKPLIIRHLEMLKDEKDIRIVVGYQADEVIKLVRKYRDDVIFVFNHNYRETGTGASVVKGSKFSNEFILSLDGDLLIHPEDMKKILNCEEEFVGGCIPETEEPWLVDIESKEGMEYVRTFSKNYGKYEWNGVVQIKSEKIQCGTGHVFQLVEPYLALPFMLLDTREVDTISDYEKAVEWIRNGYK